MSQRLPYDSEHAVKKALQARPGPGVTVPGLGVRDDVITHVCPECGGRFGDPGAVRRCWACFGKGEMTTDDLVRYENRLQERAREEEKRNGTAR